uniref:Uncharacterized protein n=1 Tax=Panagrolaimus sp. ES5 TaxID=591445 RepID=A0AC34GWN6_9BILA
MNTKTPKLSQNLIKSCKYFFSKNTVLPVHCLSFDEKEGWKTCSKIGKPSCKDVNGMKGPPCHSMYNIDYANIKSKLWITNSLEISTKQPNFASTILIPKLFKCEAFGLDIENQEITFKEYLSFTTSVRRLVFSQVTVTKEDGNDATEEELRRAPKCLMFGYFF